MPGMGMPEFGGEDGEGEAARRERLAGADPLYEHALACVQQGRWAEAQEALGELQSRYAGSAAVEAVQEALALHLSAERTWAVEAKRRAAQQAATRKAPSLKTPSLPVRVLIVANLVLYIFVVLVWLLLQIRGIIG